MLGYNGGLYLSLKGVEHMPYFSSGLKNRKMEDKKLAQFCSANLKVLCWLLFAIEHRVDNNDAHIQI